eukprot:c21481_g1_i1 orf=231-2588(-)
MSAAPAVLSLQDVTFVRSNSGRGVTPTRVTSNDISSSSDEFHTKVRKPYTITKQREKWTEQEHQKFLEALKLYGRSWRHIKEHIGTKTAIQIRSHAQKFFFKVEREASNNGLSRQVQEIEIPPPRPKRKPNRPYPRKAGSGLPLLEEHGDTSTNYPSIVNVENMAASNGEAEGIQMSPTLFRESDAHPPNAGNDPCFLGDIGVLTTTNSDSVSSGYSLPTTNPSSFSSSIDSKGLPLKDNNQHDNAPGSYEAGVAENVKPLAEISDKVALHNDSQQVAEAAANKALPCKERNSLVQPQMGLYNDSEGSTMEAPNSADDPNSQERYSFTPLNLSQKSLGTSPYAEAKLSRHSSHHDSSNSDPTCMWMDSLINYYGGPPLSRDPQTASYGPAHEHPAFPTSPWQFMQASLMNHSAAFAATMAAAAWAMGGTGSASPYTSKGCHGVQPSPEDLSAAAFAAASASWWALSRFVPDSFSHQRHHPFTGATSSHVHMRSTTGNTPQQEMPAKPTPIEDGVQVFSAVSTQGYKANKKTLSNSNTPTETLISDICIQGSNGSSNIQINSSTLAPNALGGADWKTQEGSSSGSNTPALGSHSSEQDIPSPSDNDNEENIRLCIPVDDAYKGALGGDECGKMKFKNTERGRHQQKEPPHGENENGKRFKSSTHDMDSRKEVSLQGRKAFEALFTCRTLPQTFRRAVENKDAVAHQEKAKPQIVSVPVKNSIFFKVLETDDSTEWAITENDEPATNCFKAFSTKSSVDMSGTHTSLNNKSRTGTSGFTPYRKPFAE